MADLILGTRGSKLALTQSEMIAAELRRLHPGLTVELKIITTKGDRVLDVALSAVGDKGLFVKELEQALLDREVDLCVHSCKDLPSEIPPGLALAAFPRRADPRDALVLPGEAPADDPLAALAPGAIVGTSSLRRACQLRALRPDLDLRDVRGNVDTRLRKLAEGQYGALVLAAAGLDRLGLGNPAAAGPQVFSLGGATFTLHRLPAEALLPAVTQGTLAVEARADDAATLARLAALDSPEARLTALAERAFLRRLEGGCQVPIAAHATLAGGSMALTGMVGALDGSQVVRHALCAPATPAAAEALGVELAEALLARGAAAILDEIRAAKGASR